MRTVKKAIDKNEIINEILLSFRSSLGKNKIWVLVEGETDKKLFAKIIDGDEVKVYQVGGIRNLKAILLGLPKNTKQVIGIRDADFLHLNKQVESIPTLFVTDYHDTEMMIISSDKAFLNITKEYLPKEDFNEVRIKTLKSIVFIGAMRWLNNLEDIGLDFDGMGIGDFFDSNSLLLNHNSYQKRIHQRSSNKKREITIEEVEIQSKKTTDYFNLCQGHDFEKAFAIYVNDGVSSETIGSSLRIAYRKEDFQQTRLYQSLKNWEESHDCFLFSSL